MLKNRKSRCGFTLIELLAVIAIIAILAAIVVGVTGVATKKASTSRASADLEKFKTALEEYRIDQGAILLNPGNKAYITNTTFEVLTNYVADLSFVDPWGTSYQYERLGKYTYAIRSAGPDTDILTEEDNVTNESGN